MSFMIRKEVDYNKTLISVNDNWQSDIEFNYYAQYINHQKTISEIQADSEAIAQLSTDDTKIDVIELKVRPLSDWPEIVDIFIKFATFAFATGFFGQMGADLYTKLKEKIISLIPIRNVKYEKHDERGIHVNFPYYLNEKRIIINVALKISQLNLLGKDPFSINSIISFLISDVEKLDAMKVLIMPINEKPYWKIVYYCNSKNEYLKT